MLEDTRKEPTIATNEPIESNSDFVKKLQKQKEQAELRALKLEDEIKTLKKDNELSSKELEELRTFKSRSESQASFKKMGGKDDYFDTFLKLKDELGDEPDAKALASFKEKYSMFFNKDESTPTSAIAGGDGKTPSHLSDMNLSQKEQDFNNELADIKR